MDQSKKKDHLRRTISRRENGEALTEKGEKMTLESKLTRIFDPDSPKAKFFSRSIFPNSQTETETSARSKFSESFFSEVALALL